VRVLAVPVLTIEAGSEQAVPQNCCDRCCSVANMSSCGTLWYCHCRCCAMSELQVCTRTIDAGRLYMSRDGSKVGIRARCAPALGWLTVQVAGFAYSIGHILTAIFVYENTFMAAMPFVGLVVYAVNMFVQWHLSDASNDLDWRY